MPTRRPRQPRPGARHRDGRPGYRCRRADGADRSGRPARPAAGRRRRYRGGPGHVGRRGGPRAGFAARPDHHDRQRDPARGGVMSRTRRELATGEVSVRDPGAGELFTDDILAGGGVPYDPVRAAPARRPGPSSSSRVMERLRADPETVERDLVKLVLTLVELIRQLMERQALRRAEGGDLTDEQVEQVGLALLRLDEAMVKL